MDESILFSLGFLSQNSLWKLSLNRGYKGIYIVWWEGMWKVSFSQIGCSGEFKPQENGLTSLRLLSCSATASATHQLLACLARVHHSGGLQPRVPVSLHNLKQFFTLSHTLPLHDSHLNTRLLIAKIQANLARNKANKMVDKIQPYNFGWEIVGDIIKTLKENGDEYMCGNVTVKLAEKFGFCWAVERAI